MVCRSICMVIASTRCESGSRGESRLNHILAQAKMAVCRFTALVYRCLPGYDPSDPVETSRQIQSGDQRDAVQPSGGGDPLRGRSAVPRMPRSSSEPVRPPGQIVLDRKSVV